MQFHNVTFKDCEFNDTTIFRMGLFNNVVFSHVNLTNTTLYRIRLLNVTLLELHLKNDIWRSAAIHDALLTDDSLVLQPGTERDYALRIHCSPTSKTRQGWFRVQGHLSIQYLKNKLRDYSDCDWARDIHLFTPTRTGKILSRLAEHEHIIDRIMRYCFPGRSTHIFEYPKGVSIPRKKPKQLYRANAKSYNAYDTTYFGSLHSEAPLVADMPAGLPQRGVGGCTGLLLVNKQLKALALKHMYTRTFHLQCSAEGAREFLVANPENMKMAKQVVLYYHWGIEKLVLSTEINAWRLLLGKIRHRFSFIRNIRLHVGKSFWSKYHPLRVGFKYALDKSQVFDNPIIEANKFAAPEDRWRIEGDESTRRTDGTVLQIDIEDTDTLKKDDFVRNMSDEIERQRAGRPLFVHPPGGKETAYKCAGDFKEGR